MFASRSVPRHLARGAVGLPLMVAAFVLVPWAGPLALLSSLLKAVDDENAKVRIESIYTLGSIASVPIAGEHAQLELVAGLADPRERLDRRGLAIGADRVARRPVDGEQRPCCRFRCHTGHRMQGFRRRHLCQNGFFHRHHSTELYRSRGLYGWLVLPWVYLCCCCLADYY